MAKYSDIKGFTVQTLSTDTVASAIDAGSWASGADLNTNKFSSGSGGTGYNSAIVFGGFAPTAEALTEQYNGSSWTEVNDLNTARGGGAGIGNNSITANLFVGSGSPTPVSAQNESWNGTSWTEVNDLNAGKQYLSSGGTQTSGIIFGGRTNPSSPTGQTETWDGTSWTEVNDLNSARLSSSGVGTQTAALNIGGLPSPGNPSSNLVESWNGSSWTEITEVNTGRQQGGSAGEQTDALLFGGYVNPPISANTEFWNGTTWTEIADLSVARYGISKGSIGTSATSLATGGYTTDYVASTEEWTAPATFNQLTQGQLFFNSTTNTFKETLLDAPAGTWASGGNLNSGRNSGAGAGASINAGLTFGGPPALTPSPASAAQTEQYNGTSWTEVGDLNTGKALASSATSSPYTDTLNFAGNTSPSPVYSLTNESWNGSSWTEQADLNVAGNLAAGIGISSTAALRAAGQSTATPPGGPHYTGTEVWNGSSWTEVNEVNTGRRGLPGVGTTTAGLIIGGDTDNPSFPGGRYTARTESWNGTSWTEVNDLNSGRGSLGAFGDQTSAVTWGGGPPVGVLTEAWNGSSWSEVADMTYPFNGPGGCGGTSVSGLRMGGESASAPENNKTEEWSGALTNKTITTS